MSMENAPVDSGAAEVAGPEVEAPGETGSEAVEQPDGGEVEEAPPRQYVEVDDPDNRYVRVRVDGEDVEVPYSEALRGYSREADYTRKAQTAAQMRQEAEFGINLQRALEANPEMTLRILAEQRGITFGQQGQQAPAEEEIIYADPLEKALVEERRAREALEARIIQRETDEALERAVAGLRQQHNLSDDDVQEVIGIAYRGGYDIEALPMIAKAMTFDRLAARVQAQQTKRAQAEAETARRTAAKSAAGQVVTSRTMGANGITNQAAADGRMTLREALEAAFEQT